MKRLITLLVLGAVAFAIYCAATGYRPAWLEPYWHAPVAKEATGRRARNPDEAIAVLVTPVKRQDVPVNLEAIGTAQPLNQVVVRAQIDGRLSEVLFKDGQDVKAGDILARIDATTYQAQYDQTLAKKAQDEAQLANALKDLERYKTLASTQFTSRQQADTQASTVAQLQALVQYDAGVIANAKAILDYAVIKAPIDGRAGFRAVDPGNVIHAGDTAGLVTITRLQPIGVVFNLPQQHLRAANEASKLAPLNVAVLDADSAKPLDQGMVTTIDNQVDATTGSVKFRAEFPNANLQLWPGQFVNIKLVLSTLKGVLTVPTVAVQRGPAGAFVYAVAEGKAVAVPVNVPRQDETTAVVEGAVSEGQSIITSGFARLKDGAKISVGDAPAVAEPKKPEAQPAADGTDAPVAPKNPEVKQTPDTPAAEPKKRRKKDGANAPAGAPAAAP